MSKLICAADPCPIRLSSACVFYEGPNLIYINATTNQTVEADINRN